MNKKAIAIWLAACCIASPALAKAPAKTKPKPLSTSAKMDQLGENQLKLLMIQERELQYLRDILQQMKAARPSEPGFPYPYTYP